MLKNGIANENEIKKYNGYIKIRVFDEYFQKMSLLHNMSNKKINLSVHTG